MPTLLNRLRRAVWALRARPLAVRITLGLVLLLIDLRAVLPGIARDILVSQIAAALHAETGVDDVALSLHRGEVEVRGLTISLPRAPGAQTPNPPVIWFDRLAIELGWRELLSRRVRLVSIALDAPHVALKRMADGMLDIARLGTAADPQPTPAPEPAPPAEGEAWTIAIDRVALRDGSVKFHDLQVKGSEPLEVGFDEISAERLAFVPNVYGQPTDIAFELNLGTAMVRVKSTITMLAAGVDAETRIDADRLPLERGRVYLPMAGWSGLGGELDAHVNHHWTTGTRHDLNGSVGLRDLTVHVAGDAEPVLSLKGIAVDLETVDLVAYRAALSKVKLDGLDVLANTDNGFVLPLLAGGSGETDTRDESHEEAKAEQSASPPDNPAPAQPWAWSVASLGVYDSQVRLQKGTVVSPVGVELTASEFTGDDTGKGLVDLTLAVAGGSAEIAGTLRAIVPSFDGSVRFHSLGIPAALALAPQAPQPLRSARASGALDVRLVVPNAKAEVEPAFAVSGWLAVDDLALEPVANRELAARSVVLSLDSLSFPSVFGAPPQNGPLRTDLQLRIDDATFVDTNPGGLKASLHEAYLVAREVVLPGMLGDPAAALAAADGAAATQAKLNLSVSGVAARPAQGDGFDAKIGRLALVVDDIVGPSIAAIRASAPVGDDAVRLRGRIDVDDALLNGADPSRFASAWKTFALPINEVSLREWRTAGVTPLIEAKLGEIELVGVSATLTREPRGFVVPVFVPPDPAPADSAPVAAPIVAPSPAPDARQPKLDVAALRVKKAKIGVNDRSVQPYFNGRVDPLDFEAKGIRWPQGAVTAVRLEAHAGKGHSLLAVGAYDGKLGWMQIDNKDFAIPPLNPYLVAATGYAVPQGGFSIFSKAYIDGSNYGSENFITLRKFDLRSSGDDGSFIQAFGVSPNMALALLRDASGDVALSVPLSGDQSGMHVGIASIIGSALKGAIISALTSPLKLLGAFGGDGAAGEPAPIRFAVGRSELADTAEEQIDRLAQVLGDRPRLDVVLAAAFVEADALWLREQALLETWQQQNALQALGDLTRRGLRQRVTEYLEARKAGQAFELSEDMRAARDSWLEEIPVATALVRNALLTARLEHVRAQLHERHGIDTARVRFAEITDEVRPGDPAVTFDLAPRE